MAPKTVLGPSAGANGTEDCDVGNDGEGSTTWEGCTTVGLGFVREVGSSVVPATVGAERSGISAAGCKTAVPLGLLFFGEGSSSSGTSSIVGVLPFKPESPFVKDEDGPSGLARRPARSEDSARGCSLCLPISGGGRDRLAP